MPRDLTSYEVSFEEYQSRVRPAFDAVFASDDPFGTPFRDEVRYRLILFPIGYELHPVEARAFAEAARSIGDDGFFCFMTEALGPEPTPKSYRSDPAWFVSLLDFERYGQLIHPHVETALFSPRREWGVLLSHEQHGVVGAVSKEFYDALLDAYPVGSDTWYASLKPPHEQVNDFLREMKKWPATKTWLPGFLTHMLGENGAQELLARHEFS